MSYANFPPSFFEMFQTLNSRLDKLERSARFTAPAIATASTAPRQGDIYYDTTTTTMKYWNGSAWVELADGNVGTTQTSAQGTLTATGLTYSSNPSTVKSVRIGKSLIANIQINCSTITNFGTGGYTFQLPAGTPNLIAQQAMVGSIEQTGGVHYPIYATLEGAGTTLTLWYLQITGSNTALQPLTATAPVTLATTSNIYINLIALVA